MNRFLVALSVLALGVTVAVCWIIPWRLAFGPEGSYYTFGYITDEYSYAERIQPLITGTKATNPINGICDPQISSQFFLEDVVRFALTVSGVDVIAFAWAWRIAFPVAMAAALALLARACGFRARRPWSAPLRCAAGAAALAGIYFLYDALMPSPPLQCWLNRVPTNIEFLLSVMLAWAYIRFLDRAETRRAAELAALAVVVVYLRPYLALPWGMAIGGGMLWLAVRGRCAWRTALVSFVILAAGIAPYIIVGLLNSRSPAYKQILARYFDLPRVYEVHPRWAWHVGIALAMGALAFAAERGRRVFFFSVAGALAVFPFTAGMLKTISKELLMPSDRTGAFYLVALLAAGLLALASRSRAWRGRSGARKAKLWAAGLLLASLGAAAEVAYRNCAYQFAPYFDGMYKNISDDTRFLPAYQWIRGNTPAAALFLVDDGYDWKVVPTDPAKLKMAMNWVVGRNDLFAFVARRRRVYASRLYGNALSTVDMQQLAMLQLGTFGFPIERGVYIGALKRYLPEYILWRKKAPVPRGEFGDNLRKVATVVYTDEVCEIWKMNYSTERSQ